MAERVTLSPLVLFGYLDGSRIDNYSVSMNPEKVQFSDQDRFIDNTPRCDEKGRIFGFEAGGNLAQNSLLAINRDSVT